MARRAAEPSHRSGLALRVPRSSPDSSGLRGPPRASTSTGLPRSRAPPQRPSSHSCPLSPVRPPRVAPASSAQPRETSTAHSLRPGRRQQLKPVTRKGSQCRLQEGVLRSRAGIQGDASAPPSPSTTIVSFLSLSPEAKQMWMPCLYSLQNKKLEKTKILPQIGRD
ncbi:uncharacterized protein LOC144338522 [Macaca mulatta]